MVNTTENWSRTWKSSTDPSKQRKYRENAPLHVKDDLISCNLSPELREELDTRSVSVRTGDRVKVMRGDKKGVEGIVSGVDREETRVHVDGIENERTDGSTNPKPLRPSNLQLVALNIEDDKRLEKYSIEDVESIAVEEEEMEEALEEEEENEMMQRMQSGEEEIEEDEKPEEEEETDETEEPEKAETDEISSPDYGEIVSGTISDAKEALQDLEDPDYKAALEEEKENKNRTTFTDWLESQVEE